ncbi:MAG: substrate-binding domain-containing protein [Cytophagaceae bacterium]
MNKTIVRIGGVPEHFNMPWHFAIDNKLFDREGIEVQWINFPGGTGAMNKALRENEIDVAVILTEGIVADISKGNPSSLLSFFVTSPLVWGIHVPANSDIHSIDEIRGRKYAISRYGSGSHLMAYVDADRRGWETDKLQFELVGDLTGARKALASGVAEVFFWEKFTTKPYVDNGEFRRVGDCPTPWPCFMIAARNAFIESSFDGLKVMLSVVRSSAANLMSDPEAAEIISEKYSLDVEDVKEWLGATKWAVSPEVSIKTLETTIDKLVELKLIEERMPAEQICSVLCRLL